MGTCHHSSTTTDVGEIHLPEQSPDILTRPRARNLEIRNRTSVIAADIYMTAALVAVSVFYLWPFRDLLQSDPDEGIILQGAIRILRGELPYRDFFSFYTPGSYYWNALLFKLFGESILVPRTVLVIYGAVFTSITFLLARRLGTSRRNAAFITLLLLVCCLPIRFIVLHNWDSTAAALIALYCAASLVRRPNHWFAASTGFFTAATFLFNQARGAGVILGLVAGFCLIHWRLQKIRLTRLHLLSLGSAFAAPLISTLFFFGYHRGLGAMKDCLMWPFMNYSRANRLPFGYVIMPISDFEGLFRSAPLVQRALNYFIISPAILLSALPVLVVLIAATCVFFRRKDLTNDQKSITVLCGSIVLGSLATAATSRPDFHHLTFLAPLYFFLLPWCFQAWAAPFQSLQKFRELIAVYCLLAFTAYGLTVFLSTRSSTHYIETRRGTLRSAQLNDTIPFIQQRVPAGSTLLVHPYFPIYSFLTATTSPVPYEYLQAGMHTPEQFHMVQQLLQISPPQAILLEPGFADKIPTAWPNTPVSVMVQDPVTDFIVHNYKSCRVLDHRWSSPFLFMVRADLPCTVQLSSP